MPPRCIYQYAIFYGSARVRSSASHCCIVYIVHVYLWIIHYVRRFNVTRVLNYVCADRAHNSPPPPPTPVAISPPISFSPLSSPSTEKTKKKNSLLDIVFGRCRVRLSEYIDPYRRRSYLDRPRSIFRFTRVFLLRRKLVAYEERKVCERESNSEKIKMSILLRSDSTHRLFPVSRYQTRLI